MVGVNSRGYWCQTGSYGSCSGCDWLEGIETEDGLKEFIDTMDKVEFMGETKEKARVYLEAKGGNHSGSYSDGIVGMINRLDELDPLKEGEGKREWGE